MKMADRLIKYMRRSKNETFLENESNLFQVKLQFQFSREDLLTPSLWKLEALEQLFYIVKI